MRLQTSVILLTVVGFALAIPLPEFENEYKDFGDSEKSISGEDSDENPLGIIKESAEADESLLNHDKEFEVIRSDLVENEKDLAKRDSGTPLVEVNTYSYENIKEHNKYSEELDEYLAYERHLEHLKLKQNNRNKRSDEGDSNENSIEEGKGAAGANAGRNAQDAGHDSGDENDRRKRDIAKAGANSGSVNRNLIKRSPEIPDPELCAKSYYNVRKTDKMDEEHDEYLAYENRKMKKSYLYTRSVDDAGEDNDLSVIDLAEKDANLLSEMGGDPINADDYNDDVERRKRQAGRSTNYQNEIEINEVTDPKLKKKQLIDIDEYKSKIAANQIIQEIERVLNSPAKGILGDYEKLIELKLRLRQHQNHWQDILERYRNNEVKHIELKLFKHRLEKELEEAGTPTATDAIHGNEI